MIRTTTFLTWLLLSLWGGSLLAQGPFADLYLIGDASPGGWSLGDATPLTQDANDSTVFTWTGVLTAGEFKFVDYTSNFCDGTDLVATTAAADPLTATAYNVVVQCNGDDNKWVVSQSGVYAIELFTAHDSIAVALQSSYLPVYLIGDATPNGWDINAPTPLFQDANDPATFTWRGTLTAGEFKFVNYTGNFCEGDDYVALSAGADPLSADSFNVNVQCNGDDFKWAVPDSDTYLITLNVDSQSLAVERWSLSDSLFLLGSATPNGWDIGQPTPMQRDSNHADLYTWEGDLMAGEFKLVDYRGNFCEGNYLQPPVSGQDALQADSLVVITNCAGDDFNWSVAQSGRYRITADVGMDTIRVELLQALRFVYLLGDATPAGWDIANPAPLTRDSLDADVFTWEGILTAGEFKFPLFAGDWCDGEWINAAVPDQGLNATDFLFTQGCDGPDNKWRVAPADSGEYRITLDLAAETIDIVRLDSSTTAIAAWTAASVAVYPNPAQDRLTVRLPQAQPTELTLYTVTGQRLQTWHGQAREMTLSLPEQPSGSLLLLRITTADGSVVKQVLRR